MTAADSYLTLRALVDEFARCGAQHAVLSPGSRNTPIVLTLARDPRIHAWSQIDERTAGFFALGIARSTGLPVILTCTSGTAASNLLPAIVEAHEARVPLIVLTADRPPELQQVAAGQTINQTNLYGDHAKWFYDLGVPQATPEHLRWIRATACRAFWTASQGRRGPVHLNLPLREPLVLDGPLAPEPGGGGRAASRPWVSQPQQGAATFALPGSSERRRMVWVAGDLGPDPALGGRLARLAASFGVPLLADPLSGARSGPAAIAHFDLILREPQVAAALTPDLVIRFGDLPTSKPLRAWLDREDDAFHVLVARDEYWSDPGSKVADRCIGPLGLIFDQLEQQLKHGDDGGYLALWNRADSAVAHAISEPLAAAGLSEPAVATALGQFLPANASLIVAASMPIRDVEEFFPALHDPPRVFANRGANGIDGTVATAAGVAAVADGPTVLLTGDVTLAHDVGSLLAAARAGVRLTVVVINNHGGGIFNFLAVAAEGEDFERYIATPPDMDLRKLAELCGASYAAADDSEAFATALFACLQADGLSIIEVSTERRANRQLHADVERAAVAALTTAR